ncbi:lysozyme inhibitor LprI family protein [Agaribacterium sp. ZY112]|uniref:lysozyme inhibitor LprI family protein n=1 Tax=Agaribacterium sp. ZY112 TaxID=3233574 RepID=UPI0035263E4D
MSRAILFFSLFFSSLSYSVSFDCEKARADIESEICAVEKLSNLDDELAGIYNKLRSNSPDVMKDDVLAKQRKWLETRNNNCKEADESCLEKSYRSQIDYFNRLNDLVSASKRIARSFKPGTMTIGRDGDVGVNNSGQRLTLEDFKDSDLFSSLSMADGEELINWWNESNYISVINSDLNEDYLVDSVVYQTVGSEGCSKPFVLIRHPDMSVKLANTPQSWKEDGAFCGSSLTVFKLGNNRLLGHIDRFGTGGGRLYVYADINDTFSMSCSTLFSVKTKYKKNRYISYHDAFQWVLRNQADIETAINNETQSELSIEVLSMLAKQELNEIFLLDVNGDGSKEELKFVKGKLSIKNSKNDFIPIDDFWKLRLVDKKHTGTSYNVLNRYNASYLLFRGEDNKLYMIHWSNAEFGWRQSQSQLMFLYRLGGNSPEYLDSLRLEPDNTYFMKHMFCD